MTTPHAHAGLSLGTFQSPNALGLCNKRMPRVLMKILQFSFPPVPVAAAAAPPPVNFAA